MENNFPLSDVVEILNRDDYLATQMEKFANLLNIPLSERIHLKDRENYDYITNLLQRWVGRRGKEDANLIKLIEILEKGELKSAGKLYRYLIKFTLFLYSINQIYVAHSQGKENP